MKCSDFIMNSKPFCLLICVIQCRKKLWFTKVSVHKWKQSDKIFSRIYKEVFLVETLLEDRLNCNRIRKKGIRGLFLGPASVSKWDHPLASGTQLTIRVMERRRRTNERETVDHHNLVDHQHNTVYSTQQFQGCILYPNFCETNFQRNSAFLKNLSWKSLWAEN